MTALEQIRKKAIAIWEQKKLMEQSVTVSVAPLSVEQAIGKPEGHDYPIQKGKEKLIEASFQGVRGQAFTDACGEYCGKLCEISMLDLHSTQDCAIFVATLNAVMRSLQLADCTIHCRDSGPRQCSERVVEHIRSTYGEPRIGLVGYQPSLIAALNPHFATRVLDLDPDNIGQNRHGALVEGPAATDQVLAWADLLMVTGTTLANNTIDMFLGHHQVLFYGTTIAAAASLMNWNRYCPCSM